MSRRVALVLGVLAAFAQIAAADPDPGAEQLFRDGKRLMKAGNVADACAAFEASERAEHNIATVMNLADCHEKLGDLASAWALYLRVDGEARTDAMLVALGETARTRAAALEDHLSSLVVDVPAGSSVHGLRVTRDGIDLDPGGWNLAIPVDGGDHVIVAKAPAHEPWTTTVHVAARDDHATVEVPELGDLPPLVRPLPPAPVIEPTVPVRPRTQPGRDEPDDGTRTAAWTSITLAGGGALAVAAGGALWSHARDQHRLAELACPSDSCDPLGAIAANDAEASANRWAHDGNLAVGIGAIAVVAGVVVWITHGEARRDLAIAPQVGGAPGLVLAGGF